MAGAFWQLAGKMQFCGLVERFLIRRASLRFYGSDVRSWHKADIPTRSTNVRFGDRADIVYIAYYALLVAYSLL
jgi:hypothetical protein